MKDKAARRRPGGVPAEHTPGTHVPVLLDRILHLLTPALEDRDAVCVDATLGLGGHTEALLTTFPRLTVVGLDRDPEALRRSGERLAGFGDRFRPVHAVYDEFTDVLARLGYDAVHGVLFDLGVSSLQLDEASRGFAYAQDAPLDMRMDPTRGRTAEDIVNDYSAKELSRILRVYGEEKFASRVAAAIVRERDRERLTSSSRLAELVRESIPAAARRTGGHPAKRTFQALRIEVNEELSALETAMPAALEALAVGGRIAVLAYHSLEDRIVKRELTQRSRSTSPLDLPVELPEGAAELRLLTRGAEPPTEAEIASNPRSASAKLRAAERIRESAARRTAATRADGRRTHMPTRSPGGRFREGEEQ
ncbi:16S rRNA (cytosine(1402)-N(4))-methyltransferase RsmH [Longispora fulva]|uniref:Ribosomal RNA small subunit methyltransferase H n=1 Tax=Longispora fulva TaxID=619741 RepID=A0A8J7KPC8_9ACTN|nr:16S rRNA (cytosine(1402)-N(4))-methyltransferase RsmH [Longispora fulva]MBG6141186.1 16S rRNA (cytosine1402-N4)-methyltransferase [Longispora fulva]